MRPVIITSITDVATAPDLLDRGVLLELAPIAETSRRSEAELFADLDRIRPLLLGALLDAVAGGLRLLPSVRLSRLPRMADHVLWGESVFQGLGHPGGAYLDAYEGVHQDASAVAVEACPVGEAVLRLGEQTSVWAGTPADLLVKLESMTTETTRRQQAWPKSSAALSKRLKRIAPVLRREGVTVTVARSGSTRRISILREQVCTADIACPPHSQRPPADRPEITWAVRGRLLTATPLAGWVVRPAAFSVRIQNTPFKAEYLSMRNDRVRIEQQNAGPGWNISGLPPDINDALDAEPKVMELVQLVLDGLTGFNQWPLLRKLVMFLEHDRRSPR